MDTALLEHSEPTTVRRETGRRPRAPRRLSATPAARALIGRLQAAHGPLMFHQSGGNCESDLPLCFVRGDFPLVEMDVLLGEVGGAAFYVSHARYRCYEHARVRLDAVPGRAGVFSLERPTGLRFATTVQPPLPAR